MLNINDMNNLIPKFKDQAIEYKTAIYSKYTNYMNYTELPQIFEDNIDKTKLPKRLNTLYQNVHTIVNDSLSFIFAFENYKYTHNIAAMIINKYFIDTISKDTVLKHILYIDTNLLMEDYKKLMNMNDPENGNIPVHKVITLNRYIYDADLVIWDKTTMLKSNYDKDKFYEILSARYRKGLANIFFINTTNLAELGYVIDDETMLVMTDVIVDCSKEIPTFIESHGKESVSW